MSTIIQRALAGGVLDPALHSRVDTVKYQYGAAIIRNFFIKKTGGVASKPGSIFVGEVSDSSEQVRLVPVIFDDVAYVLEFGDSYMRVILDGQYVLETAQNITGVTQASTAVLTYSGDDNYSDGDEIYIEGIVGMTELNGRNFKIDNVDTGNNTVELYYMNGDAVDSQAFTAYASGGTLAKVYTEEAPYDSDAVAEFVYDQSEDELILCHNSNWPLRVVRTDHDDWTIYGDSNYAAGTNDSPFLPDTNGPTGLSIDASIDAGSVAFWSVSAVNYENGVEAVYLGHLRPWGAVQIGGDADGSTGTPAQLSWSGASSNADEYRIYKSYGNHGGVTVFGLIGVTFEDEFDDDGIEPDYTVQPPMLIFPLPFDTTGSKNSMRGVGHYQQRRLFFASPDEPRALYASRVGALTAYTVSTPLIDSDAMKLKLKSRGVHVVDLGACVIFAEDGEIVINHDGSPLTPSNITMRYFSHNGTSRVKPIKVNDSALYIDKTGSIIRDFTRDISVDGYTGNDLTTFAGYLFDGFEITDWCYQQTPHSVVWAVRSDGKLLALTYIREHQIWGWTVCDTDGEVENVACIPETLGGKKRDAVYMVVKRTIDGETKRYTERMTQRRIDDIVDFIGMDCTITYDGRNDDTDHTMTLSGGTDWDENETITITSSDAFFSSGDVGNAIHLTGSDGTIIRFDLTVYTSSTVMEGRPHKTIPVAMRSTAISDWAKAVDELSGLWHLEGKEVSIFADGFVVASPNNASYDTHLVENGSLTLDRPYGVIHVGLPFIADLETLDVDSIDGRTIVKDKKLVNEVMLRVKDSRGIFAGPQAPSDDSVDPLEDLFELKARDTEAYDEPTDLDTGNVEIPIQSRWSLGGRVFIRQVDPLPLEINSIAPSGVFRGK